MDDYQFTETVLVFNAFAINQVVQVEVPIVNDTFLEGDEDFFANLNFTDGTPFADVTLTPVIATVNIWDDDGELTVCVHMQ